MTSTPHPIDPARLAARVTTLLAGLFPEYVPGVVDEGFRVEFPDPEGNEPRRMFVRWHGGTPTRPVWTHGPALGREKYKAGILEALTRAGYAVSGVPGRMEVHVADRPHDDTGPRFEAVVSDEPGTGPWLVMDRWTRAHVAVADTQEGAAAGAMHAERRHVLTDARMVTDPALHGHLERADEILGDGVAWWRREAHGLTDYRGPVRHERIDALVAVAHVLRAGREVEQAGRMAMYGEPGRAAGYLVQWVPVSTAPAVGYFPGWQHGPAEDVVIALLTGAGLHPVHYGEPVDEVGFMCEAPGFLVDTATPPDLLGSGVNVSAVGTAYPRELERGVEVLRAAGWRVEQDTTWPDVWVAFPPALSPAAGRLLGEIAGHDNGSGVRFERRRGGRLQHPCTGSLFNPDTFNRLGAQKLITFVGADVLVEITAAGRARAAAIRPARSSDSGYPCGCRSR